MIGHMVLPLLACPYTVRHPRLIYIGNWIRLISFHWKLWDL